MSKPTVAQGNKTTSQSVVYWIDFWDTKGTLKEH